jgi:hypothetical protein
MKVLRIVMPALFLAVSGTFLAATEPQWGVQGALSFPAGDLSDSAHVGVQGGGHARWNFGQGNGLMARADVTLYGSKYGSNDSSVGVAADYTYHLGRNQRGLYLLGGLSVLDYSWSRDDNPSRSDTSLGVDLGVGYDLDRHVGLQARYTSHNTSGSTLSALNLGITYSF